MKVVNKLTSLLWQYSIVGLFFFRARPSFRVLKFMPLEKRDIDDAVFTMRTFLSGLDLAPASRAGMRSLVK